MYFIVLFGLVMIIISLVGIFNPEQCRQSIIQFCRWRFFHIFEVMSRIIIGFLCIAYANQTLYPDIILFVGYMVLAVGVGLSFVRPELHSKFGIWAADKFKNTFRPSGIVSLIFGAFLIYAAIFGPTVL